MIRYTRRGCGNPILTRDYNDGRGRVNSITTMMNHRIWHFSFQAYLVGKNWLWYIVWKSHKNVSLEFSRQKWQKNNIFRFECWKSFHLKLQFLHLKNSSNCSIHKLKIAEWSQFETFTKRGSFARNIVKWDFFDWFSNIVSDFIVSNWEMRYFESREKL